MRLCNINNTTARKVLAEVRKFLRSPKDDDTYVMVEVYANCREQGFALSSCGARKVAFAQYRRSDDIVVYFGKQEDFAFNTNIPTSEVYEEAQFYSPRQIKAAARAIVRYLKD